MKNIMIVLSVVGLLSGCDFEQMNKERQSARYTIDSLRFELAENQKMTQTLVDVGVLLDSIDAGRNVLRTNMLEGTSYENYVARLSDINQHVRKTESKLTAMEKSLRDSRRNATYAAAVKKLKADLDVRTHELKAMQELVDQYRKENNNLVSTVNLQRTELDDKMQQLRVKQEEVENLDAQVKQLLVQSKIDEGEAYFLRAAAIEETANRTRFAPRKKRETRKEALELYRMALFCGKAEAEAKINALQSKL